MIQQDYEVLKQMFETWSNSVKELTVAMREAARTAQATVDKINAAMEAYNANRKD